MNAVFIALLAAHAVADFALQPRDMVLRKREPAMFAAHGLIVGLTAWAALGAWSIAGFAAVALVVAAHLAIDAAKTYGRAVWPVRGTHARFTAFWLDQLAHLISILAIAVLVPTAFAEGAWAALGPGEGRGVLAAAAVLAGFLIATRGGQFLIAEFMARFPLPETRDAADPNTGLVNGGAWIGLLERALTFGLVLAGRFEAIGFLIAAKSVLRFNYASQDRAHSEYVIIGTLASFGWALAVSVLTRGMIGI